MNMNRGGVRAAWLAFGLAIRLLASLVALQCGLAGAASVRPLSLDEMTDNAAVIIEGTCIENRVERDAVTGFVVTYTTFQVRDTLKGQTAPLHVIKQIGGALPDEQVAYQVGGVPSFSPGNDYVVFLAGVSRLGFSSPLGLAQGRFDILAGPAGAKVSNGRDFRAMTAAMEGQVLPGAVAKALAESPTPVTAMALDDFKATVRTRLGRSR